MLELFLLNDSFAYCDGLSRLLRFCLVSFFFNQGVLFILYGTAAFLAITNISNELFIHHSVPPVCLLHTLISRLLLIKVV